MGREEASLLPSPGGECQGGRGECCGQGNSMRKGQRQGEPGGGRAETFPQEAGGGIEVLSASRSGAEALKAFSQFWAFSRWRVWVGSRHPEGEAVVLGSWKALSSPGFSGCRSSGSHRSSAGTHRADGRLSSRAPPAADSPAIGLRLAREGRGCVTWRLSAAPPYPGRPRGLGAHSSAPRGQPSSLQPPPATAFPSVWWEKEKERN